MKIEVITIGNELLDGRRVDTNTTWIGHELYKRGYCISYRQTVCDVHQDIQDAFVLAVQRSDLVISTGGLGPTVDDITFESLAQAFDQPLEFKEDVFAKIQKKYEARGIEMPMSNRRQALVPECAEIIENEKGTAPGLKLVVDQTPIFVFPGVPIEMQAMFEAQVVPILEKKSKDSLYSFTFSFFGLAESVMEEKVLASLEDLGLANNVAYSVTASFPLVHFQFRVQKSDAEDIEKQLKENFFSQYSQYLWKFDEKSIEQHVILAFKERGWSLHVAESTSGGMVSSSLVDVPGCSEVFHQGLVTYSNESKRNLLGVSKSTLQDHGAVSRACALEMARGLRKRYGADVGVSTTGIAGPTGGSAEKPVGRTYIAWTGPGFEDVSEFTFQGDRAHNRILTTHHALIGLYKRIQL